VNVGKDVGTDELEARAHERGEREIEAILEVGGWVNLGGRSPLTELEQGHVSPVVRAAQAVGEHGAA
jgi:hypothetical protein